MDSKTNKIIYLISTGLLSLLMVVGSAGNYIFNHQMVREIFRAMEYPTHIIYPLAIAKILGIVAIWTKKSQTLKEWAYAGFCFNLMLAIGAHLSVNDGGFAPALVGMILLFVSYFSEKKLNN